MVEPRLVSDLKRFGIGRPKSVVGSKGSAVVGGQMVICLVRLYGSPTVVVWSKEMYSCRAKTVMGSEDIGVGRCREIATGSVGICGSRAKVSIGCVMLVGSRKIASRYVMIGIGCSVDYTGSF